MAGTYHDLLRPEDYIELKEDGTFYLQEDGRARTGEYTVRDDVITLVTASGDAKRVQVRDDNRSLLDTGSNTWIRRSVRVQPDRLVIRETLDSRDPLRDDRYWAMHDAGEVVAGDILEVSAAATDFEPFLSVRLWKPGHSGYRWDDGWMGGDFTRIDRTIPMDGRLSIWVSSGQPMGEGDYTLRIHRK